MLECSKREKSQPMFLFSGTGFPPPSPISQESGLASIVWYMFLFCFLTCRVESSPVQQDTKFLLFILGYLGNPVSLLPCVNPSHWSTCWCPAPSGPMSTGYCAMQHHGSSDAEVLEFPEEAMCISNPPEIILYIWSKFPVCFRKDCVTLPVTVLPLHCSIPCTCMF